MEKTNILKLIVINFIIIGLAILAAFLLSQMPLLFEYMKKQAEAHEQLAKEVEEQLGFEYEAQSIEYLQTDGKGAAQGFEDSGSVNTITKIIEGKAMATAGFKENDIFAYQPMSLEPFIFLQEETAIIPIIRDKKAMDISIAVPKLELSIDPYELRWPITKQSKFFKYEQNTNFLMTPYDIYN